jgi:hypothetical protein
VSIVPAIVEMLVLQGVRAVGLVVALLVGPSSSSGGFPTSSGCFSGRDATAAMIRTRESYERAVAQSRALDGPPWVDRGCSDTRMGDGQDYSPETLRLAQPSIAMYIFDVSQHHPRDVAGRERPLQVSYRGRVSPELANLSERTTKVRCLARLRSKEVVKAPTWPG